MPFSIDGRVEALVVGKASLAVGVCDAIGDKEEAGTCFWERQRRKCRIVVSRQAEFPVRGA